MLILTSTLPRWENDSEPRFVLDLAHALSDRFEPTILAPMTEGAASHECTNGVRIRRYRYAPIRSWEKLASPGAIMPNLRRWPWLYALVPTFFLCQLVVVVAMLRRERFDLIHCHWIIPQGLVLALASLFVRVPPTLITCHGADAFTLDSPLLRRLKSWILSRFDAVSVVSREIAEKLIATMWCDPSRSPIHIPMGVDLRRFSNKLAQCKTRPIILFVGRLATKKGVVNLIEAFADIRIRDRGVQLRIIGSGPLLNDLEALVADHGLRECITFMGPMSHERIAQEMRSATLFCAPFMIAADGDREGTPTVLLEAAASGLPIITSDVGGCGDIVVTNESGWLLPPNDIKAITEAIQDAVDHPDRAQRFAEAGRKKAEQYSWPVIAERHASIFHKLLRASAK